LLFQESRLADVYARAGRFKQARAIFEAVTASLDQHLAHNSQDVAYQRLLAIVLTAHGEIEARHKNQREACVLEERASRQWAWLVSRSRTLLIDTAKGGPIDRSQIAMAICNAKARKASKRRS
jgi:hypothetical protein